MTSNLASAFRVTCGLILFVVSANIFPGAESLMANSLLEGFFSTDSDRRLNCYKVIDKVNEQSYTRLIEWIVLEEADERHRFLVITGWSNRVYEDSLNLRILSVQDIQALEDAFKVVASPDASSTSPDLWDMFGSDTLDNSIDRVKTLFGSRFLEIEDEPAPTDTQEHNRIFARLKSNTTHHPGVSKEEQVPRGEIKNSFRELRRKARSQQAYWKPLDPTPAGRECYLLVTDF